MAFDAPSERENVALDIETAGFGVGKQVTALGILPPDRTARILLNAAGRSADPSAIEQRVVAAADRPVTLTVAADEEALLSSAAQLMFERVDRAPSRLVAYNGETWDGGFDLPFLRTRCGRLDVRWPFDGYTFTDLKPLVDRRFNTAPDGASGTDQAGDLVTVHQLLCQPDGDFDPLADSAAAVECFRDGSFDQLVLHNLSDLHRTLDLAELACRFAPARAFRDFKL